MDRLVRRNVWPCPVAPSRRPGDVDVLLLDKTGTITSATARRPSFLPLHGVAVGWADGAPRCSPPSPTKRRRRSIVTLSCTSCTATSEGSGAGATLVEFSATTRMSGIDLPDRVIRKGPSASAVAQWVQGTGPRSRRRRTGELRSWSTGQRVGRHPLVVADRPTARPARVLVVIT